MPRFATAQAGDLLFCTWREILSMKIDYKLKCWGGQELGIVKAIQKFTFHKQIHFTLFVKSQVRLQIVYIFFKSLDTYRCYFTDGLRIIVFKLLHHFNISCFFQLVDLHTEIARRCVGLLFNESELSFFQSNKKRYYSKP